MTDPQPTPPQEPRPSRHGAALCRRVLQVLALAWAVGSAAAAGPAGTDVAPAMSTPATSGATLDVLRGGAVAAPAQPELLLPDEAFRIELRARDANTLVAVLTPAPGYYLYRDRIDFKLVDAPGLAIAKVVLPPGKNKDDPTFGPSQVFYKPVEALITLSAAATGPLQVRASYQGCNEPVGVCYPPIDKTLTVSFAGLGPAAATGAGAAVVGTSSTFDLYDEQAIQRLFGNGASWALLAAFFGFGLLLAFTPCMLPMIPILSGIIAGQKPGSPRRHALGLSAVYVLAMALTYALAGIAAGLAGAMLAAWLQNPWVLGTFALVFVGLALSMFGLYELQMPAALQNRLNHAGQGIRGGRVAGVFAMGVLSAVIVGPCVAAPLAGALLYIGQTGDAVLGGSALFAMALGMGVPLLAVGASTGALLPKNGAWTESVRRVFGVLMLALAIYIVSPVIPVVVQQLLWAALLIVPAIFLHALDPLPAEAPGHRRLFKGVGVVSLLLGAAMLVGALSGHREILQPLAGLRGAAGGATQATTLPFQPVTSIADLDQRLAGASGRMVMLDFTAEWCVSCKEMEQFTFSDAQVRARLNDMLLLQADVTQNNDAQRALLARFGLFGPPGIVFFDREGRELPGRIIGYQPAPVFLASIDRITGARSAP
jgi:thiol:disulfide interchange protein DsbD